MSGVKGMRSPNRKVADPIIRFWKNVVKQERCWVWIGTRDKHDYGCFSLKLDGVRKNGRSAWTMIKAHRYSWQIHFGLIPDGKNVLHRCDNPRCVNPHHLFIGTQDDNMKDMATKGRSPRGNNHWSHRMPERMEKLSEGKRENAKKMPRDTGGRFAPVSS